MGGSYLLAEEILGGGTLGLALDDFGCGRGHREVWCRSACAWDRLAIDGYADTD